MDRDERLLEKKISEWEKKKEQADDKATHLKEILEKVKKAREYLKTLTPEKVKELKEPLNWRNHEELNYVFEMNELF